MRKGFVFLLAGSLLLAATSAWSATAFLPRGTIIYGQLAEEVTSSTRKFRVGFEPYGHVWKDVEINGITIIEAGTPIALRISRLEPRGVGGRGAEIEITAMFVEVVGGDTLNLLGGYGQRTADRSGLNQALSMLFWPTSFLPGRRAVLEEGMVFDMEVPVDTYVDVPDDLIPTLNLKQATGLSVSVVYDQFTAQSEELPLEIRLCDHDWTSDIFIDSVNDESVRPIEVSITNREFSNNCDVARTSVELKKLSDHFRRGLNRFTVTVGDLTEEVMLNVEI